MTVPPPRHSGLGWAGDDTQGAPTHHLLDPMECLPVKTEGLLKQDFIFHSPLIWEGGEVGQISQ